MNELLQHIENKFKGIEFNEEKHLYSVNGSTLNTSVSGRIKQYFNIKLWKISTLGQKMKCYGNRHLTLQTS